MNSMYRIDLYYKEGTKDGKKYKVPHTTVFGFDVTVQLNGNAKALIKHDAENDCDYVIYDAKKAGLKFNAAGYLILHITD